MMRVRNCVCLLMVLLGWAPGALAAEVKSVTVSAGKIDRSESVVVFPLAGDPINTIYELVDEGGRLKVQMLSDKTSMYILPELKAGQSKTYTLFSFAKTNDAAPDKNLVRNGNSLTLSSAGRKVFTYNGDLTPLPDGIAAAVQRGGYLHPVLSPLGKVLSDDYAPNHPHHHGLWAAWTKTEFEGRHPDFWNMQDKTGRVEFVSIDSTFAEGLACGFAAKHRYVDLTDNAGPKVALNETWETTVYRVGTDEKEPYLLFDVSLTQTCATKDPLILPKYLYGGIAFRGRRDWNGKGDACTFLTSEGKDRASGNETQARWCYIGGKVAGEDGKSSLGGVAILCAPSNFRSPQPVRIHPDMPYFTFSPVELGEFKIEPGKPYVSRYRVVTTDGAPDSHLFDRLWEDFGQPVEVAIK